MPFYLRQGVFPFVLLDLIRLSQNQRVLCDCHLTVAEADRLTDVSPEIVFARLSLFGLPSTRQGSRTGFREGTIYRVQNFGTYKSLYPSASKHGGAGAPALHDLEFQKRG